MFLRRVFLAILFFEILSFYGHFVPFFSVLGFFLAIILFCFLTYQKFEYGIYFLLTEIVIGSFGRLFSFEIFGFSLSLRMAIWILIMFFWFLRVWIDIYQKKINVFDFYLKSKYLKYLVVLSLFVLWGVVNGFLNNNSLSNIYSDMNAWLYLSVFFPFYYIFKDKNELEIEEINNKIAKIILVASLWISVKSFFILYAFSHNIIITSDLYSWVRDTRVGEITKMKSGFVRIFFQSHIFVIISLIFLNFLFIKDFFLDSSKSILEKIKENSKLFYIYSAVLIIFINICLINLSRSNWVGLFFAFLLISLAILYYANFKKLIIYYLINGVYCAFAFLLILGIINFPFPSDRANIETMEIIKDRTENMENEAGASSRFALLPKLWDEIKKNLVLGQGYGTEVTYKSSDPRILENNPDGEYTTFTFEWGWLDIWLKIGLVGVVFYVALILVLIFDYLKDWKNNFNFWNLSFSVSLITVSAISFFSPYLNHPLGISFLVLGFVFKEKIFEIKKGYK